MDGPSIPARAVAPQLLRYAALPNALDSVTLALLSGRYVAAPER